MWDLVQWLTSYGFSNCLNKWLSHNRKARNMVVAESMRLDVSTVPVCCWNSRQFSKSCLSSVCIGIPKKKVLIPAKECLSNRIAELVSENERKLTKIKIFLIPCSFMCAATRCDPDLKWFFSLQIIQSRKCTDAWVLVNSMCVVKLIPTLSITLWYMGNFHNLFP